MRRKLLSLFLVMGFVLFITACSKTTEDVSASSQNEAVTSAEGSVVKELSLWNHTTDNWQKVYYQTEEDGEWLEADWDYENFGLIQSGDGPTLENVELNEHYFAVKALTESNQEKVWTYDLVFGENREYYTGEEEITNVNPDWTFLQLDITDNHTAIYWTSSDGTSAQQSEPITLPAKISQITILDTIDFCGDFYYKLSRDGEWLNNWTGTVRNGMVYEENVEWLTIEEPFIAFKAVNDEGNEKVAIFNLTIPNPYKPSSFWDEGEINIVDFHMLDDGSYEMNMTFVDCFSGMGTDIISVDENGNVIED